MRSLEEIIAREEELRLAVRDLPDDQRKIYFRRTGKEMKDPDTYATLNWFFIIGLHHMYLREWLEAALVWLALVFAIFLILANGNVLGGIAVIGGIVVFELFALFNSQRIVRDHNLDIGEAVYRDITGTS